MDKTKAPTVLKFVLLVLCFLQAVSLSISTSMRLYFFTQYLINDPDLWGI